MVNVAQVCAKRDDLLNLKTELQSLIKLSPSPIKKNVAVTTENMNQINKFRREWNKFFNNMEYSKTPLECYLNIQTEIESIQDEAKVANVLINPECCFGFAKYLNSQIFPDNQSLQELDRHCRIMSMLVLKLIESSPFEILSFARETVKGEVGPDDEIISEKDLGHLRIHDIFCSNLYKLSFTGSTQSLRLFINKMHHMQIPIFIRDIEVVQPLKEKISPSEQEHPIFSITLELIDFKFELV